MSKSGLGTITANEIHELELFKKKLRNELNKEYQKNYRKTKKSLAFKPVI
jgi:hypothetical protein